MTTNKTTTSNNISYTPPQTTGVWVHGQSIPWKHVTIGNTTTPLSDLQFPPTSSPVAQMALAALKLSLLARLPNPPLNSNFAELTLTTRFMPMTYGQDVWFRTFVKGRPDWVDAVEGYFASHPDGEPDPGDYEEEATAKGKGRKDLKIKMGEFITFSSIYMSNDDKITVTLSEKNNGETSTCELSLSPEDAVRLCKEINVAMLERVRYMYNQERAKESS